MIRRLFLFVAFPLAVAQMPAQQPSQAEVQSAIQRALTRIAQQGQTIENLIYVGMTPEEVSELLGESYISIDPSAYFQRYLYVQTEHKGYSSHGEYVILWSDWSGRGRPVVTGYIHRAEMVIRRNLIGQ